MSFLVLQVGEGAGRENRYKRFLMFISKNTITFTIFENRKIIQLNSNKVIDADHFESQNYKNSAIDIIESISLETE